MRLFARQDLRLLAGLTAALIVVFSDPLTRVLDYTRDIERQSGLALTPALILLTFVYIVHEMRKRTRIQAQAAMAEAARHEAQAQARELERLVAFGHALARTLDHDSIRAAVSEYLPRVAGTDDLWVLLRHGTAWEALTGDACGAEGTLEAEGIADRLLAGSGQLSVTSGASVAFPLLVGGSVMGVLGIRPSDGGLPPDRQRALEASAALLAVSLKNAQLFREVRENSLRDGLTGCFSRAHAMEVIDAELRRSRRSQRPASLIMFDLDHFKDVNDRYGHLCGDAVLAAVGQRMRAVLRGSDLKCRYGGEEFLVLLPDTPLGGARRVAETVRKEIADRPVPWAGEALTITASFGITQATPGDVNIQSLIGRADAALYRAKADGRNCVRIASETLALLSEDRKPTRA